MEEIKGLNSEKRVEKYSQNKKYKKENKNSDIDKKLLLSSENLTTYEVIAEDEDYAEKKNKQAEEIEVKVLPKLKKGKVVFKSLTFISVKTENGSCITLRGYKDAKVGDIVEY